MWTWVGAMISPGFQTPFFLGLAVGPTPGDSQDMSVDSEWMDGLSAIPDLSKGQARSPVQQILT